MAAAPPPPPPPPGPPPVVPVTTFEALYANPDEDPYEGDYAAVLTAFQPPTVGQWTEATVHQSTLNVGGDRYNAYVRLFEHTGHPEGRTRLVHAPRVYPALMGRPTAFDNAAWAILDDAVGMFFRNKEAPAHSYTLLSFSV